MQFEQHLFEEMTSFGGANCLINSDSR